MRGPQNGQAKHNLFDFVYIYIYIYRFSQESALRMKDGKRSLYTKPRN